MPENEEGWEKMLTPEQCLGLMRALVESMRMHVKDPGALAVVEAEFVRLTA